MDPAVHQARDPDFNEEDELDVAQDDYQSTRQREDDVNNQLVSQIEKEAEMNRKAREYVERLEGRRAKRGTQGKTGRSG